MTKDQELQLAKNWLATVPKESYLWDLLNEAIPLWERFIQSDGFYCEPLNGLYQRKEELRAELSELKEESKKLESSIRSKELELDRMRRSLIEWHTKIDELANDCRYLSARLFKHGTDYEKKQ